MFDTPNKKGLRKSQAAACICLLAVCLRGVCIEAIGANKAADPAVTEYQVKALYLYYFAKFVDWPQNTFEDKTSPIIIGIIGDDAFGNLVEAIAKNKTAQEHPIAIRRLKWSSDLRSCHMLFISTFERKRLAQISAILHSRPILTITEMEDSLQDKGIMNLIIEGGKVQFEVDIAAAERAQLRISSKLLRMAKGTTGSILSEKE
jgi:hypothetical protein